MKKMNFEQMENISGGATLSKNQQCLLIGGLWVAAAALAATGGGWAALIAISGLAVVNC